MEIILGEIKEEREKFLDTNYIVFSTFKNGFLKQWIHNRFELKQDVHKRFTKLEVFSLVFMSLMFIRIIRALTFTKVNDTILMYYGSSWHYMSANSDHVEFMFLLWSLNYLSLYFYVIHNPNDYYNWLNIYGFLGGIIPHKRIGIYLYLFFNTYQ